MRRQLLGRVPTRRDADCTRAYVASALNVSRRVADNDDMSAGNFDSEDLARATLSNRRKLGPKFIVRAERANCEHVGIDTNRLELRARSFDEIAREQAKRHVVARVQHRQ